MNEEELFHQALALSLPEERAAYLERACAGDRALRESIETLLLASEEASGFMSQPAPGLTAGKNQPVCEAPGTVIDRYKLLEPIGEGGMGVVYMAEQMQPVRRKVALKVIKPGMDTKQVIARFDAERQALALMDHPNIARILDAGTTPLSPPYQGGAVGRPYFVMELVRGIPITEYCDRNRLSIADRLDLFVLVCQAVQHAHLKGIIRRDIKPSNVLITLNDGTPVPKVIDFGIAKATGQQSLTEKTLYTAFAELLGTPMYLSPEQAELSGIDIDTRSDIYSLGVLLYELLTGTTPFDQATFRSAALDEVRRIIREEEPPPPSTRLGRNAPTTMSRFRSSSLIPHPSSLQELDWITMKALEKDRRRRYETAGAFAADIERYRKHEPVEAGPPSAWYRGRKFARRHRLALTMTAIVALSLVVAWMWAGSAVRLDRTRRAFEKSQVEVKRQAIEARHHRYAADIRQAYELVQIGRGADVRELLDRWLPAAGEQDVRNFAWHYLLRLCHDEKRTLRGHQGVVFDAQFSPDGRTLVSCGQDGTARIWEVATGRLLRTIAVSAAEVDAAAFSSDGRTIVTAGDDGHVRLWDVASGSIRATIAAHHGPAGAGFTGDGRRLISGGRNDHLIKVWDVATSELLASKKVTDGDLEVGVLSPDGKVLATAGGDGCVRLWILADLSVIKTLAVERAVFGLAFSSDGTRLATADGGGRVLVWDLKSGEPLRGFQGFAHRDDARAVAFLAGDRMVVSADGHAALQLSDATTGNSLATLNGHTGKIWGLSVSPDRTTFATASGDGTVKLWDARQPQRWLAIPVHGGAGQIAFTPDGQTLVVANTLRGKQFVSAGGAAPHAIDADFEVSGFDPKTGAQRFHRVLDRGHSINPSGVLSRDGALALVPAYGGMWTAWETATGKRLSSIDPHGSLQLIGSRSIAVRSPGGGIELDDVVTGQRHALKGTEPYYCVASAPEAQVLALRTGDAVAIWDLGMDQERRSRRGKMTGWTAAAFSPDATILATAAADPRGLIQLWDVNTLELLDSLPGRSALVGDLDFSPDGTVLASLSSGTVVKLWDVAARMELLTLQGTFLPSDSIRFAPDGRTLAFRAMADGKAWVYLLTTTLPEDLNQEEGP